MSYVLAVDLGTTFTAAAILRGAGEPQIVSLEHQGTSVPSVLYVAADQSILVGTAASRRASVEPSRVVREFKRRIGDTTPILVGGAPYSAEQLSAKLLRWVADRVTEQEGSAPAGMAITHPANWGPYKLELLNQLLRMAEVGPSVTLTEPQAAAIHYASTERVEVGEVIAVYDLGGGTFDVAILRKTADGFEVLGDPEGVERLGGVDFDAAVYGYVIDQLGSAVDGVPADDPDWIAALTRIRDEATNAKETLSVAPDAVIEAWLPNGRHQIVITREQFADMITPPVIESVKAVRRALQGAHVAPGDVSKILMVGGSSRVPIVKQYVAEELGIDIALDTHPKHAVVLGAARFAAAGSTAFREEIPQSRIAEVAAPVDLAAEAVQLDERVSRGEAVRGLIGRVEQLADECGRTDLAQRMRARRERLDAHEVRVLIVGDFKQGKSMLVNSLVGTELSPSHPDFATAIPTSIRHADTPSATIYRDVGAEQPEAVQVDFSTIGRWVSETEGADPERDAVRSCEVALPIEWMSNGVELVDMPGYGGLDAIAGARFITELRQANAVLFVTDSSQELTGPELDFLRTAVQHCPSVTTVLSKIDAYVDWRLIRDLDTRHLQNAGLDVPIIPVSALLHRQGRRRNQTDFDVESGVDELKRIITTRIVAEAEAQQIVDAALDAESTLAQIRGVLSAELQASDPQRQASIVAELRTTLQNVQGLRLDSAPWHRLIRDGVEDLRVQSIDDFERITSELVSEAESAIAANDPSVIWEEFQAWLRARTTSSVGDLYGDIATKVTALEHRLLEKLADEEQDALVIHTDAESPWVGTLRLDAADSRLNADVGNSTLETSWGVAEPLLGIGGFIPGLGPISLAVAAVAGLVFGRKAIRQRKARALDGRREQARSSLQEYIEDVQKVVQKSIDRYVSQLYRGMRDGVLERADQLERSVSDALRQSMATAGLDDAARIALIEQLRPRVATTDSIARELSALRDEVASAG